MDWRQTTFRWFRERLRTRWSEGFWFPLLVRLLEILHDHASVGVRFKHWLRGSDSAGPPTAAEMYVALTLVLGVTWLSLIRSELVPTLSSLPIRYLGLSLAMYRVAEIEVFSLHWVFASTERLRDERRSLAIFLINLLEVSVMSSVAMLLLAPPHIATVQDIWYENAAAVFGLRLATTDSALPLRAIAHVQLYVAATVLSVVVANLIGSVAPKTNT